MALETKAKIILVLVFPILVWDVVLYLLSLKWLIRRLGQKESSVAVGDATVTHGVPRRSLKSPDKLIQSSDTLYDMIQSAVKKYGDKTALVSRKFIDLKKLKETDRFPTKVYDDNELQEMTYEELGDKINCFGAGLRSLGMEPIPQLKEGQSFDDVEGRFVMVIFEDTSDQWTVALHGAVSQSITVATCYATLGEDAVVSAVKETGATTLFLNWKKAEEFAQLASSKMPTLKYIVASTYEMPEGTPTPLTKRNSQVKIISSDELIMLGSKELSNCPPVPPKPHDVAVIMYTSGSTGKPKGVVMKHSQIVSGVDGMAQNVFLRGGQEINVSYLPLAHVLALQIENHFLRRGGKICHSDARSLGAALPLFRPTVHAGVPRVYEMIQAQFLKTLNKAPGGDTTKLVFDACFAWKSFLLSIGVTTTPISNLFFQMIAKKVWGGIPTFIISGGGALNASLHNFCRVVFCCPMIQGYALTETCVGGCFQALDDSRSDVVGPPVPCVEIMLQSEPEIKDGAGLPYLHTDTMSSKGVPIKGRGEICMRGPSISAGYYKLPEQTKSEYDEDGWFHTGDIGQFTEDGVIQIIDRKKNIVKLSGGEYVAVEAMETAFGQSPFVQMVCVIANDGLDRPLIIFRADDYALKHWAEKNKIDYDLLDELAGRKETRQAAIKSMVAAGKEAGLTKLELGVKDCVIVMKEEWGPGHGMTASMKLDRGQIYKMHATELNDMYERNGVSFRH
jgi:long-chain acyl-CoA synthetase